MKEFGSVVTEKVGMARLKVSKFSPEIFLGLGLATMAGAVISGIMAARNHDDIIASHNERLEEAKAEVVVTENEEGKTVETERSEKEIAKNVRKVYFDTGVKFVRNYALTGALMGVSAFFFCEMHNIQNGRIAGISGAYTGLQEYIKRYEENNIKLNGKESHNMCKYGFKEVEVEEEDPDTGEVVKEKKKVPLNAEEFIQQKDWQTKFHDQFAEFSRQTSAKYEGRASFDLMALENAEKHIQNLVASRGWAVVNEARIELGLEPTKEGMVEGWVKHCGPDVSFGYKDSVNNRFLACFDNEPVLLEFNIHGNVYDLLTMKERKERAMTFIQGGNA